MKNQMHTQISKLTNQAFDYFILRLRSPEDFITFTKRLSNHNCPSGKLTNLLTQRLYHVLSTLTRYILLLF